MPAESDKIMFEVYRESGFNRRYQVVYFTELDEDERDQAIEAALSGEHFYDGFIAGADGAAAKEIIEGFLQRLNRGGADTSDELEVALLQFLAT